MISSSIKLLLRKDKKNSVGLHPIYLRITVNRKSSYVSTGHYISEKYWDNQYEQLKDGHINADLINADLNAKKREALDRVIRYQVSGRPVTAAQLKKESKGGTGTNIFEFAEKFKSRIAGRREESTLQNYDKHLNRLEQYHGSRNLIFEEIDDLFLSNYEAALRREELSPGYIYLLLRAIRILFNAAKAEKVTDHYPFATYELPDPNPKAKEYLSIAEIKKLENHLGNLDGKAQSSALYFLLGCYTGLRVSDWRRFSVKEMIRDSWIRLHAKKNGAWVSMPVPPGLARILPMLSEIQLPKHEQEINYNLARILPEIGIHRHITTHCARHTFAVSFCADRGISCEVAAELMGITVEVCANTYYKITNYKIEAEVRKAWEFL